MTCKITYLRPVVELVALDTLAGWYLLVSSVHVTAEDQ